MGRSDLLYLDLGLQSVRGLHLLGANRRHLQLLKLQQREQNLYFARYVELLYGQTLCIVEAAVQNCVDWRITVCYND